jgi:membrane protein YqaA with SNARE-associated domain
MLLNEQTNKLKNWFVENSDSKKSQWLLGIISFTESSFFPIPPDPFLMASLLFKQNRWIYYSSLVTITSVLGAMFGYLVGHLFNEFVVEVLVKYYKFEDEFNKVAELFGNNTFWTMFISAFTPIPFKVFTISGGIFGVNLLVFIIASILGRGLRFFIIGFFMKVFGERLGKIVFKYFNLITIIILVLVIVYLLFKFI